MYVRSLWVKKPYTRVVGLLLKLHNKSYACKLFSVLSGQKGNHGNGGNYELIFDFTNVQVNIY